MAKKQKAGTDQMPETPPISRKNKTVSSPIPAKKSEQDIRSIIKENVVLIANERKRLQLVLFDSIGGRAYLKILNEVRRVDDPKSKEIDVIVHSSGGSAEYAYRIISLLHEEFKSVTVVVPFWAKSAATLLALGAQELLMGENAELGPLDAQITERKFEEEKIETDSVLTDESSLANLEDRAVETFWTMYAQIYMRTYNSPLKMSKGDLANHVLRFVADFYEPLLKQIDPYKMGKKRRITQIALEYLETVLTRFGGMQDTEKKDKFKKFIVYECPDHGYIVDYHKLIEYLPNVKQCKTIGTTYDSLIRNLSDLLIKYRIIVEENDRTGERGLEDIIFLQIP
jgi:hypothetical protein